MFNEFPSVVRIAIFDRHTIIASLALDVRPRGTSHGRCLASLMNQTPGLNLGIGSGHRRSSQHPNPEAWANE